ncbi:MAG: metallophosphoesterase family protein [Bacilli bacterium]|nr:metallophosphoesterase family protein [Bacilli bacterium]
MERLDVDYEVAEDEVAAMEEYSKETIDNLLEYIKKEKHISQVSNALGLRPYEILGLVYDLKDSGFNIIAKEYDDGFHLLNQGDQIDQDISHYEFETDDNNEFKFVAISDVRLGSKSQQLGILKDIYKKAQEQGINNVIVCGNISAGLKPIDTESNFIIDTQAQIDYIVNNYPHVEGIKTYFVSGKLDDMHISKNKINIGQRIAAQRPDMIYLGEDVCDIDIDRVKMQVMSCKLSKTYTASYRTQQTIDAYRSEDKPDVLIYGGLLQMEQYTYRNVKCISTPSVCATDKEMKTKRYANTVGAWYVTVKVKQNGKLDTITALNSPYYSTNKEDYKGTNISTNKSKKRPDMDNASIQSALKTLKYVKNGMSIDKFMEKFHISYKELQGLLLIWESCNQKVDIVQEGTDMVFRKQYHRSISINKPGFEKLNETEILVVSDTHFGSIHNQLHLLNDLYQEAYNRGIKTVLHVGDMTDGNYLNRPESPRQQFLHGFDEQAGYVVDMYPEVDGMETYYILGSHDETHYKNGGATISKWVDKNRKDMHYLGQDTGEYLVEKVKIVLDHPGAGSTQALSYKPQKRIEIIEAKHKPNILLIGHYHKSYAFVYRNVQCIEVPSLCDKTQFQQKQGLINNMGGYFLKIYYDSKGHIQYLEPEEVVYGHKDVWDEAGKDKRKVKKLEIKHGIY